MQADNQTAEDRVDFCTMLLAMASHDLRQPLQVIVGAHDLLVERLGGGAFERDALARIERATDQLADGFAFLVDALHLRHKSWADRLQPVQLDAVLSGLTSDLADRARQKGIELRILPAKASVLSHPTLLHGILRNLMRNALQYTPPGGRVLVGCRRRGSTVHIEVRDNGVGIATADQATIFHAFHRADATRVSGLGLGLFIVKNAAEHLGHRVELYSAPGRGSCFVIVADHPNKRDRN